MALTYHDAKRLWEARLAGRSFDTILGIGRLQLFLHPQELEKLRRDYAARVPDGMRSPLADYRFGEYADRFWTEFLDAKQIESLDYSSYEGASRVHDLNLPVDPILHERFDAVIEAGTLEHIFDFPVAIRNVMQMARVGGTVYLTTVANNLCGHGFYQFSPELIYRIFSPENGFEAPRVVLLEGTYPDMEVTPMRGVYEVIDPKQVGGRVGLQGARPVMMMVEARRASAVTPFRDPPQQSDYVTAWEGTPANSTATRRLRQWIFTALPKNWQRRIIGYRSSVQFSFSNRRFYRRLR